MAIRNLVFEGGGVKGIAYAGALEVLEGNGYLNLLQNVAGTSAGAITAAMMALNYKASKIKEIILNFDFKQFEDGFDPLRVLTSYGLYKGDAFLQWMKDRISDIGGDPNMTFADLNGPGTTYRHLSVVATDLYTQNIQVFSKETTPNTIVAEAVRASMSIPIFFKSWQFSNQSPNDHIYVDGGVILNYPIELFDVNGVINEETLGLYLANVSGKPTVDAFGHDHIIQYIKSLFDTLLKVQNIDFSEDKEEEARTIIIDDLGISATDFGLTAQQKQELLDSGSKAAKAWINANPLSL
ncbi:MAG: patatin-like phospholipase family protein [Saprospiraceae bacterium]|nr:patatin-like phospholipase family protein [Saprospiraceae bacterium]